METPSNSLTTPQTSNTCPTCHIATTPEFYFCPNCGTKLHEPPLSTAITAQLLLYAFSIILPMIGFIAITKWKGLTYFRSQDIATKKIGILACTLITLSTVITLWLAITTTQKIIQSSSEAINNTMNDY